VDTVTADVDTTMGKMANMSQEKKQSFAQMPEIYVLNLHYISIFKCHCITLLHLKMPKEIKRKGSTSKKRKSEFEQSGWPQLAQTEIEDDHSCKTKGVDFLHMKVIPFYSVVSEFADYCLFMIAFVYN